MQIDFASWRFILVTSLAFASFCANADCPSQSTADRFTLNGAEVTDKKTGLVWATCSLGQSWSGSSCSGMARTYTHEEALQLAQAANGWRLPNVKELSSIVDKGCQSPAINSAAFPNTPDDSYWTSSPYVGRSDHAWVVFFYDGYVYDSYRSYFSAVRLVRTGP